MGGVSQFTLSRISEPCAPTQKAGLPGGGKIWTAVLPVSPTPRLEARHLEAAVAVDQQREWVERELALEVCAECAQPPLLGLKGHLLALLWAGKP